MRRKGAFDFKQFRVQHDRCTMKVGTDAVLLGAWVRTADVVRVLDIGTGSGVIALMLAQRTDAGVHIDAVEVAAADAEQAWENVQASPWPHKINIHQLAVQDFAPSTHYELIVSNPPYFSNSWLPSSEKRKAARHTESLSHDVLLRTCKKLLTATGRLAVVLPTAEGEQFKEKALNEGYYCLRSLAFFARSTKPQERWLFEFAQTVSTEETNTLVLYQNNTDNWSEDYRQLTREFYLHT